MVKPRKNKRFRWFFLLRMTGIVIFIVILSRVDIAGILKQISQVEISWLFLGILFQVILLFLKALRWHLLNDGTNSTQRTYQSLGEFFESYAIGVITPGRLGEVMKAGYAIGKSKVIDAGIRVMVERGYDLGIFLVIAGLALCHTGIREINPAWGWLIAGAGMLGMGIAGGLMVYRPFIEMIHRLLGRIKILQPGEELTFIKRPAIQSISIFALSVLSNMSYFVSCFFLALGIVMTSSFIKISGGVAIAGMLNMLPITIMGLGTRDLTFLYVFNDFPAIQVLAFSGLIFLVAQIGGGLLSLIFGQIFLFMAKRKSKIP